MIVIVCYLVEMLILSVAKTKYSIVKFVKTNFLFCLYKEQEVLNQYPDRERFVT